MTVLVTGLDQPIGRHILDAARAAGQRVRVLSPPALVATLPYRDGFEHVAGAIDNAAAIAAAVRGVDVVYHTATVAQGGPPELRRVNAGGTRRLLEACAGDIKRFVFISNPAVYHEHPTPETWPVRADARRDPHGPPVLKAYGDSLVEAEDFVLEAGERYGMEHCLLRLTTVWSREGYPSGVVNALMRRPEMAEQMYRMLGPIQWIAGRDAARAALLAGEHPAARNEAFLVAAAEAATTFDLLAVLWDITRADEPNPFSQTAQARRLARPKMDIGKIGARLGWAPQIGLRECLEEVLGRVEPSPGSAPRPVLSQTDMRGKTCVITGATSGIGLAAAQRLAALGAHLVLVGRDPARGEAALRKVRAAAPEVAASMHYADLSLMHETRRVAAEILSEAPRIDVLVNNVGAMFDGREVTEEGLERTFAVNHMSHFLLTELLRERLIASAPARVVTIASSGHRDVTLDLDDLQGEREFDPRVASKRGKLCNVLFTRELARRLAGTGVTANCLCPGFVATGMGDNLRGPFGQVMARAKQTAAISPEQGAEAPLYLASAPDLAEVTGAYFENGVVATPSPAANDDRTARRLWRESAALAGLPAEAAEPGRARARPMAGKTCVVTGATSGIGLAAAEELADMGARVVLIGRDPRKGEAALRRVRAVSSDAEAAIYYADLLRLGEVRRLAAELLEREPRIDVLVNNAGAMFDQWQLTEDGLEQTFALNHMAPFLLTLLLRERLVASAPARIVTVSSSSHYRANLDFDALNSMAGFTSGPAYAVSKLCNVLFTRELARRLGRLGVTANCVDPGVNVATGLGDNMGGPRGMFIANAKRRSPGIPASEGAKTVVYLAASADIAEVSGAYFKDCRSEAPSPVAQNNDAARILWDISAEIGGLGGNAV